MIERKFVKEKLKVLKVEKFIAKEIGKDKYSYLEIKKIPLGEKIIIHTAKPGLVVGKKGETIKRLTVVLKSKFQMENPQIEVAELDKPELDAQAMAEYIVSVLERFGPQRFKSIGYRTLQRIMDSGAIGAEIVISGRGVPSSRAKSWRFPAGYLKKSGDVAESLVSKGLSMANLKSGTVGIKVTIMPPGIKLPDNVEIPEISEDIPEEEEKESEPEEKNKEEKAEQEEKAKKEKKKPKEKKKREKAEQKKKAKEEKKKAEPKEKKKAPKKKTAKKKAGDKK